MLLSIIIPCYNSEKFISNTLDMLVAQGLENCEVIIVNDGSTDNTSTIAHSYAIDNEYITVIDKQNEGVSVARNVGIQSAQGKYIYFLDSDDTLVDGSIEFFKKTIVENQNISFFAFSYKSIDEKSCIKKYCFTKFDNTRIGTFPLQTSFLTKKLSFHICSCIFEKEFLLKNNILFPIGQKIGEDICFLLKVLHFVNECLYSARECFIYQIRNDSAMQRNQGYSFDKYKSLQGYETVLRSLYSEDKLVKYVNFFYQVRLLNHLRSYLTATYVNNDITEYFVEKVKVFKSRVAFGNLKFTIILFGLHLIPTNVLIKIIRRHDKKVNERGVV